MNKQSIQRYKSKGKSRQPKLPKARRSNKATYKGHEFDSETELGYFMFLERDPSVDNIEIQPVFQIIQPYEVECKRCEGRGTIQNVQTGNLNKCRRCKLGRLTKAGARYTADFAVTYIDGRDEVIDVKGGPVERDFPLRKTLYEQLTGKELVVVRWNKSTLSWKRE